MTTDLRKHVIGRFLLKPAAGLAVYYFALVAAGDLVGAYSGSPGEVHGAFMFMTVVYLSIFAVLAVLAASIANLGFVPLCTVAVICAVVQVLIGWHVFN